MAKYKIHQLLAEKFNPEQLQSLPDDLLNKEVNLIEITDKAQFIEECESEAKEFKTAGPHRRSDWEKGWAGEGVFYSCDEYNNIPYYFYKNTHVRVNKNVYEDKSRLTEYNLLRALQVIVIKEGLKNLHSSVLVEYGCGTGSNIQYLRKIFSDIEFFGTDWALSAVHKLIENNILEKSHAHVVDFFDESTFFSPKKSYIAFTNASLEQTGGDYKKFIDYLIHEETCVGAIHIEPIRELLDLDDPLNKQSFRYAQRRGYLNGFFEYLRSNNVTINLAKDFGIGSKYISGYQVIIWSKAK